MSIQRYFKPKQKLLLRLTTDLNQDKRTELLSAIVVSCIQDTLTLKLWYGDDAVDQYPFREGLPFEITTESLGVGIRATGSFMHRINGNQFAVRLDTHLQIFQRRISQRLDCKVGIRFSRAAKNLENLRSIWERNLEVLRSPEAPLIYEGFKTSPVNLSSGGIRLVIKPPAHEGELGLLLIDLEDGGPPISTIVETVWFGQQDASAVTAGMRFINILSDDQKRIDLFIEKHSTSA